MTICYKHVKDKETILILNATLHIKQQTKKTWVQNGQCNYGEKVHMKESEFWDCAWGWYSMFAFMINSLN